MSSATIETIISGPSLDIDALAAELNAMDHAGRVRAVRSGMDGKLQARLWDAAAGRGTTLDDLVPASVPAATEVIHAGKNSLPMFSTFEKRFCRSASEPSEVYGYNEGSTRKLIGPGYFVATVDDERGEVGINYYKVPPEDAVLPADWPKVKRNEKGLQRFVFAKMIDYLRKVSDHVAIGRAVRQGKETNNYFILVRPDVG